MQKHLFFIWKTHGKDSYVYVGVTLV